MATLPSSLALTTIADGSNIVASDHRNNYAAIQTETNALLTILGAGTAGDVFSGVGTTVQFAKPPGYEFAYNEFTATVNVASTAEATGTSIIAASAVTFDGATAVLVEFFAPLVTTPTSGVGAATILALFEGATEIGRLGSVITPAAALTGAPFRAIRRFTPSAGSHTYTVTASASSTTGTPAVFAGAGGTGTNLPGFIRITKA